MGELERAILDDDIDLLTALCEDDPGLIHREGHWTRRKRHNQYLPLAYAAHFGKVKAMEVLIAAGSDIHAGEGKALRAATYSEQYQETIDLLIRHGADPNATTRTPAGYAYSTVDYPCMLLASGALQCLLSHGARLTPRGIGFVVAANERNPQGKSACLAAIAAYGFALPDTPPMALHRRDRVRLEQFLRQDPGLMSRAFVEAEIFPSELGTQQPAASAYVTPLTGGVTLLHMAVEFCDAEIADWLLRHGADVNAAAAMDAHGFGGWTPLFHAVATLHHPRSFPDLAALLLQHGANLDVRASIRKPTPGEDNEWAVWENVTAAEYARDFVYPDLVNHDALRLIEGGN